MLRNGQLRDLCGFDPFDGAQAVPSEYAYTRFQGRLRRYQPQIDELFHSTLDKLRIELPDLGQVQALDGKELHSLANGESNCPLPKDSSQKDTDGRRDRDAAWGVKGSTEKKHYWFGYPLHLVVDATYEVPLAFEVTKASSGEQPQAQRLLDQMQERHPELLHGFATKSVKFGALNALGGQSGGWLPGRVAGYRVVGRTGCRTWRCAQQGGVGAVRWAAAPVEHQDARQVDDGTDAVGDDDHRSRGSEANRVRYFSLVRSNSACRPSAVIRPPSRTRMRGRSTIVLTR